MREPDYIIEDEKQDDQTVKNRSGFLIFTVLIILAAIAPLILIYENFTSSHTLEALAGWYDGTLEFETTENDPEGYYDSYPEYLVAGKIPVFIRLEAVENNEGLLTVTDAALHRRRIVYKVWIENDRLIGEPYDEAKDVETRVDLYSDVISEGNAVTLSGNLGIKDLNNAAVAVFNLNAERTSTDLDSSHSSETNMESWMAELRDDASSLDLSGLWIDMTPAAGLRFAIFDKGSAFDPEMALRIDFSQPAFVLLYADDEYEVIPYEISGRMITGSADYLIMDNGKIFVTSESGSYLIDETVFEGEPLVKVKLGDLDQTKVARRIHAELSGGITVSDVDGYLHMDISITEGESIRAYSLMMQILDF